MLTICIILIVLLALDLLFTLALRCRKGHRKWEVLKKYRYTHRGYHDKPVVPENSLPAFRRAIERGFGAELEIGRARLNSSHTDSSRMPSSA